MHFTVLVIGDNPEDQLAPFQENNMGDCPEEYLVFFDDEEAYREEYENRTTHMIKTPLGELVDPYDDRFKVNTADGLESIIPEDHEQVEVPISEVYKTFDDFMDNYYGLDKDPETGKYGYWENPNSRWDWYELGGRWTGLFLLKPGAIGKQGRPGLHTNKAEAGHVDQARKKDIDWEGMRRDAEVRAIKNWYEAEDLTEDERHWRYNIKPGESREEYIKRYRLSSCTTYAFIRNGEWCARDSEDWYKEFNQLLDDLPDDTLLSVYDCHT